MRGEIARRRAPELLLLLAGHILARKPYGEIRARFDLHKAEHAPLPCDEIHLTEAAVVAVREELIAPAAQEIRDLCLAPRSLGAAHCLPAFHFFRNVMRCSGQGPYWSSIA